MNGFAILKELAEHIYSDANVVAYSNTKFGEAIKIYIGVDENKPPAANNMPFVMLSLTSSEHEDDTYANKRISVGCAVKDETTGSNDFIERFYAGYETIENFENLVHESIEAFFADESNQYSIQSDGFADYEHYHPFFYGVRTIQVITQRS